MSFKRYWFLVLSDLYRIVGNVRSTSLLRQLLFGESFKYIFWMRTCELLYGRRLLRLSAYPLARLILRHYSFKLGISIPWKTRIGSGFYIGHFGGVVVNGSCVIGNNCNLSHDVTLGVAGRAERRGAPILGDNVYIAPGAKVIGPITIGNNAAIGANCVVTRDVPENAVVVGIPGRVISLSGSHDFINRTDYGEHLQ